MDDDAVWNGYRGIGALFGAILSLVVFVGSWWYCAATYGYLFGFGLGWLPSAILATFVFFGTMLLWPLGVLGLAALGFVWHGEPTSPANSASLALSATNTSAPLQDDGFAERGWEVVPTATESNWSDEISAASAQPVTQTQTADEVEPTSEQGGDSQQDD